MIHKNYRISGLRTIWNNNTVVSSDNDDDQGGEVLDRSNTENRVRIPFKSIHVLLLSCPYAGKGLATS